MKWLKPVKLILILLIFSSCNILFDIKDENNFVKCTSGCYNIKFDGSIIDKVTNTPVKNTPVTLNWVNPTCITCPEDIIDVQYSKDSGNFSFTNSIDTSYFSHGYHLNISIPEKSEYIIFPQQKIFSVYNPNDKILKSLKYELYPKTQLLIQTVREKTDVFDTFIVGHAFRKDVGFTDRTIRKTSSLYDYPLNDSFNVETSADIKTYITWTKVNKTVRTIKTDSIICKRDIINTYKITY